MTWKGVIEEHRDRLPVSAVGHIAFPATVGSDIGSVVKALGW